jgi:(1->4)-alpha-D-glucan 1-alpha-D-glucosylmutase
MSLARVPTGTYRLQLRREFGFVDAAAVVPYLAKLGVSHVYCSPVLQAVPGSAHGYDVIDHTRLNDELGGADGWHALVAACREHQLGIVVDVVPNHMALPAPERLDAAFWDLLANGRESSYADWFDVDWTQHDARILLPVLGGPIEQCDVVVDTDAGEVRYYDHVFPLAPGTTTLDQQHYLLTDWRRGNRELNYRRFFDVTTLIGLRVEQPEVFAATHELVADLVHAGDVNGLRIDHPDGLADPRGYLEQLEKLSGGLWTVVEKILDAGEWLPETWACDGTTGYDAATAVTRLLVDPAGAAPLTALYDDLTGAGTSYRDVVTASKRQVIDDLFGAEVDRLCRDLDAVPAARELDPARRREAIVELLVTFPVYRSYAGEAASAGYLAEATDDARRSRPDLAAELDFIATLLRREDTNQTAERFATRFEQTSGPVTAKGVEDTAFYRYLRLVGLNDVGGDPGEFGGAIDDFHAFCASIQQRSPATMTTLSTHDTKRSEDVRARLAALAEIPAEWESAVRDWSARASSYGRPDPNTEYLVWQTLTGAGAIDADRLDAYMQKAVREAKQHTSWLDPDEDYERRLSAYVRGVVGDEPLMATVREWTDAHVAADGRSNSLAQKLIQLTMPGVPDVYQGQELPDFSLVDPDNRRPVDYAARRDTLAALDAGNEVNPKLLVTARALRLRQERPDTFAGSYAPINAAGPASDHVVAFVRADDVVTVATRLPAGLRRDGGWRGTRLTLPAGAWRDVLTGRATDGGLDEMLSTLPVALLVRDDRDVRDHGATS